MTKVEKVKILFATFLIVILAVSCKDAIVVFDNEQCTESIVPNNLPQQSVFFKKDWVLYQHGTKTDLNLYTNPKEILLRFTTDGTGTIVIRDSIGTPRADSSVYQFSFKFCKTDCNCNIVKFDMKEKAVGEFQDLVNSIVSMKMYSAVTIPINNGANAINGLLLMDEKETTMTFR
jgi:hypothetical protein